MSTTTPSFGWPVPTSGDLVKNGATAIEALGDAIDASMTDLKGGTTGQVLSKTSNTDMDFTWVAADDTNAIQNTIVDAKGDLIAASAADTPARLAVGNNGDALTPDSSTSTGLRWQGNYSAGKNKIINGDFGIWQRGTSFTPAASTETYTTDRFFSAFDGTGTTTFSRQTFTPGTAPVAGYEGSYFYRSAMSSGATYTLTAQKIEDVRTFAGQTVTLSFWAKSSSTFTTRPILRQDFGSGGSASVDANLTDTTFTTSWTRYSWSTTLSSISGKTIGTSSKLIVYLINYQSGTIASNTIDVWGVQLEAGSVATSFQTATGTIQGELGACQRYYYRAGVNGGTYNILGTGIASTATACLTGVPLKVTMRVKPTSMDYSSIQVADGVTGYSSGTFTLATNEQGPDIAGVSYVHGTASMTQYRPMFLQTAGNAAGYVGFSAEL